MPIHIELAHYIWQKHLKPGMTVVDATCGNGHDSLFLAKSFLTPFSGNLYCIDIQKDAILNTEKRLKESLSSELLPRVSFHHQSHETLPEEVHEIDLIVYNLGYLPRSDKKVTTKAYSTIESCKNALQLLKQDGICFITLYPGHNEGFKEKKAFLHWVSHKIDGFTIFSFEQPFNPNPPSFIYLKKSRKSAPSL